MTKQLVTRKSPWGMPGYGNIVLDKDAAKLEAVIEAAVEMRRGIVCGISGAWAPDTDFNDASCDCDNCTNAIAFDTALEEISNVE